MKRATTASLAVAAIAVLVAGWSVSYARTLSNQVQGLDDQLITLSEKVNPSHSFPAANTEAADIRKPATDLPGPLTRTAPQKVVLNLETVELDGRLDDGTTYTYWTFNRTVPGPFLRVREGDSVELHLKNDPSSKNIHSIDLHAVNGPGGGASVMQAKPGEETQFTFQALNPGLYVYHCATPHVPTHIAQGMYGLILVEPKEGLPKVDREFYVMQSEVYAAGHHGQSGHQPFDGDRLFREQPNYVVFNGAFQSLTGDHAMKAKVGERIRLFVGNAGPNLVSSFHVIGEIFDKVHDQGAAEPVSNIQTTVIPAGGAAWVEFTVDEPGRYVLVDHAITRAIDKGALGYLEVEGEPDPSIFDPLP